MSPTVLRQSGPKFLKDGATFTPRAAIHSCEVCKIEGAPFGFTDNQGKRIYFCSTHNSDRIRSYEASKGDEA